MAKRTKPEDDPLWTMLAGELGTPEVRELQAYLAGDIDHYEMGYGNLTIEPYDARGGESAMFHLRHQTLGELLVSRSALRSVLHDLVHHLRR
jgi:hypothetical protein